MHEAEDAAGDHGSVMEPQDATAADDVAMETQAASSSGALPSAPMPSVAERSQQNILAHEIEDVLQEAAAAPAAGRSEPAFASSVSAAPGMSGPPTNFGGSFFAKAVGLSEAAWAKTNRSVCGMCGSRIEKRTVRFSWYHSVLRPPFWLHQECLPGMAKKFGLVEATAKVLNEMRWAADLPDGFKDSCLRALKALG